MSNTTTSGSLIVTDVDQLEKTITVSDSSNFFIPSGTTTTSSGGIIWSDSPGHITWTTSPSDYVVQIDGEQVFLSPEDYNRVLTIGYKKLQEEKQYVSDFENLVNEDKK